MTLSIPAANSYPRDSDHIPVPNYILADRLPVFDGRLCADVPRMDVPVFLVIGAGYVGMSAALHLARLQQESRLAARIILVDAGQIGAGPAGKSAGHVCGLQASDDLVRRHCGPALGNRLIKAADDACQIVRELVTQYEIPCDLRDGYVTIARDGRQQVTIGREFGIAPYPYLLGLAFAARALGVEIYENTTVAAITEQEAGFVVSAGAFTIHASGILAAGGHKMARYIPLLAPLRGRTTELRVSTIITDPIPSEVLNDLMPSAGNYRYPFADNSADVAYGSIDAHNRIIFGACASALAPPSLQKIASRLTELFSALPGLYRKSTGYDFGWRPLVQDERLCFTRDFLPNVGTIGESQKILYAHALGGQGVALGTLLGKASAEKLWSNHKGEDKGSGNFEAFGAVRHGRLPRSDPWRSIIAGIGLWAHGLLSR